MRYYTILHCTVLYYTLARFGGGPGRPGGHPAGLAAARAGPASARPHRPPGGRPSRGLGRRRDPSRCRRAATPRNGRPGVQRLPRNFKFLFQRVVGLLMQRFALWLQCFILEPWEVGHRFTCDLSSRMHYKSCLGTSGEGAMTTFVRYYAILYCTILYDTIWYDNVLYHTMLYYTVPYCTTLYYTKAYSSILYWVILMQLCCQELWRLYFGMAVAVCVSVSVRGVCCSWCRRWSSAKPHVYLHEPGPSHLFYTIPYYTLLYYTILYHTTLYNMILFYTIWYYTVLYYTVLPCMIRHYTILYYTMVLYYCSMLYRIILCCTIPYYTIAYCFIVYYSILYYVTLYRI